MNLIDFFFLVLSVLSTVGGQLFLKLGADKLAPLLEQLSWSTLMGLFKIPELLVGLGFYTLAAVTYILLLSRVPLSIAAPSVSLVHVFSVLLGYFVFHESIPLSRVLGLGLIMAGVILVVAQRPELS